ncbi:MAG: ribonuclease T [Gammaproteobacteria bacterium]|nr:ribonuclease T [Gammaproteobacteria bacterium]
MNDIARPYRIAQRFRGFLPVVVDVETGGFNKETDALLEIAAIILDINEQGQLFPAETISAHVEPFPNANIEPKALEITGIKPFSPLRMAMPEKDALQHIFQPIRRALRDQRCNRAILVGHNAFFDLGFLNKAVERNAIKRNPFHLFSQFDTVSLAGMAYGQTVLARAVEAAGLTWDNKEAHSAVYDATQTAALFCNIINRWNHVYPPLLSQLAEDPISELGAELTNEPDN